MTRSFEDIVSDIVEVAERVDESGAAWPRP